MTFEYLPPWWAWLVLLVALVGLAYGAYWSAPVPLAPWRRRSLTLLRLFTLLALVGVLLRPVVLVPSPRWDDAVVPVLIDISRSMRLPDQDGRPRIARAARLVEALVPALRPFAVELFGFADALAPVEATALRAVGMRTDLRGALDQVRQRYRGRRVAGIVVISDGGDTSGGDQTAGVAGLAPVYAIAVGSRQVARDREVTGVTIGEPVMAGSSVTLAATIVSHGFGDDAFEVRVLENGRPIQVRRVKPAGDGVPVTLAVQVSPPVEAATVYTVEVPVAAGELVPENNRTSVLARPPGPRRRVLLVEGAPGFEHSFLKRALARDPALEVDAVVRKGQNERGEPTFYVQAHGERGRGLGAGYPPDRETLFGYEALILANVEADGLSTEQLTMTHDFVAVRGGGLLVMGARSFAGRSLLGTPLEEVLPLEVAGRAVARTAHSGAGGPNTVEVTADGLTHPATALGATPEETRSRWAAMPPLAALAPLGDPKPGAAILLAARTPFGRAPLVAVQRYGRGRAMVFTGEASWRWRMRLPLEDRSYELFWRQAIRWLAGAAPGLVTVGAVGGQLPGDPVRVEVTVSDRRFEPVTDATVTVEIEGSTARTPALAAVLAEPSAGRYRAEWRPAQPEVYQLRAEARRGTELLGRADEWILVGGADPEFADPRRNDELLGRLVATTGGRLVSAEEFDPATIAASLQEKALESRPLERRELWHRGWVFGLIVGLLLTEWICRRRWGLR